MSAKHNTMLTYNFDEILNRENTASIKYDLRNKIFRKDDVIPMWVADMDFATPDFITSAIKNRADHPIYGYSFKTKPYYISIVDWLKYKHNWEIRKNWILFSPGVVPALNFSILTYTNKGDGIIVQPPVYFPFFNAINDNERKQLNNDLILKDGKYIIDFEDFEKKAKEAKLFFLSNPHNPVGRVWTKEELTKLGEICVRNNVIIISDEIHSDLILPWFTHTPTASLSDEIRDITVTCIAPSKTFNIAGLSTSSIIISNNTLRRKFEKIINTLHVSGGNLFGAVASEAGYNNGAEWVKQLMDYVNNNFMLVDEALKKTNSKIKLISPQATYLGWLDFNEIGIDDKEIRKILINDCKLGLSPGNTFGNGGEGFQRINVATPASVVAEAMKKLTAFFT